MTFDRSTITMRYWAAGAAILAIGLTLRLFGAHGDLWQDEVWTLLLLKNVNEPWQIFWRMHHTNNHYLNSLFQYALGPGASIKERRSLSIVIGMATIVAGGFWARPRTPVTILVGMLMFATSAALVQYQSEARGYPGLILLTIVAFMLTEQMLAGKDCRLWLALTCFAGMLTHLEMVSTAGALGIWTLWIEIRTRRSIWAGVKQTFWALWASILAVTVPLAGFIGVSLTHTYDLGPVTPFYPHTFILSYTSILWGIGDVPCLFSENWYVLIVPVALSICALWSEDRRDGLAPERTPLPGGHRLALYAITLVALPAMMFASHIANTQYPRYFMISGIAFLLLLCDLIGASLIAKGRIAYAGLATLCLILGNDKMLLQGFYRAGRGHLERPMRLMTANGPARFGDFQDDTDKVGS